VQVQNDRHRMALFATAQRAPRRSAFLLQNGGFKTARTPLWCERALTVNKLFMHFSSFNNNKGYAM